MDERLVGAGELRRNIECHRSPADDDEDDMIWVEGYNTGLERALSMLANAPTIDAVRVVRCKDCEFMKEQIQPICQNPLSPTRGRRVTYMDYCSRGHRKDGTAK